MTKFYSTNNNEQGRKDANSWITIWIFQEESRNCTMVFAKRTTNYDGQMKTSEFRKPKHKINKYMQRNKRIQVIMNPKLLLFVVIANQIYLSKCMHIYLHDCNVPPNKITETLMSEISTYKYPYILKDLSKHIIPSITHWSINLHNNISNNITNITNYTQTYKLIYR